MGNCANVAIHGTRIYQLGLTYTVLLKTDQARESAGSKGSKGNKDIKSIEVEQLKRMLKLLINQEQ